MPPLTGRLLAAACALLRWGRVGAPYTDVKPMKFKESFNPFKVLGLPRDEDLPQQAVLKKAFKKAALRWHPDRCKRTNPVEECEARMEEVHQAQEVLSDNMKLQMWEAWEEDQKSGGAKAGGGGGRPEGRQRPPEQRRPRQGGGDGPPGGRPRRPGGFPDVGGSNFFDGFPPPGHGTGEPGPRKKPAKRKAPGGGRKQGAPSPRPPPSPRPAPRPPPVPKEKKAWRVTSRQKSEGPRGAKVEVITRERDLPGTPMVQVEVLEKTCYKAQVQCTEKVVERRRRKRDSAEL